MADAPTFESPVVQTYPEAPGAALTLGDESATAKILVRAGSGTAAAETLAVSFGSSRRAGEVTILGQRPTEWLVLGSGPAPAAFVAGLDRSGHVSVVDHTHSRALFRLTGARASEVLEKICSLDWSDEMTPDGAVISASVAKTGCDLSRQDVAGSPSYLIACDRSFGQYLFDAILDAGDEFGIGVAPPLGTSG